MFEWFLNKKGVRLHLDPEYMPPFSECVVDVETLEDDRPHCIGFCGDPKNVYVYFNITEDLKSYLRRLKLVAHNVKAEAKFLEPWGVSVDQLSWDTLVCSWALDSYQKDHSLKGILLREYGEDRPDYDTLTTDKSWIAYAVSQKPELVETIKKPIKKDPLRVIQRNPKKILLSAYSNDFVAQYNGRDVLDTYHLWQDQLNKTSPTLKEYLRKIEFPMTRLIYRTEQKGIRVDVKKVISVHREFLKKKIRARKELFRLVGKEFNTNSWQQLLPILHDHGVQVPNTEYDTLKPHQSVPVVKVLLEYREAAKICSTYTKPMYKRAKHDPHHRIYCRFNQTGTGTGRLSSSDMNLQNLPVEAKDCLVPSPGSKYVLADYSQIELRIPAHLSQEPILLEAFNKGEDVHTKTAERVGVTRPVAKMINFLIANSGGPETLSVKAEIPLTDAEEFMTKFWAEMKVLKAWMDTEKFMAVRRGGISDMWGRWVPIPDLKSWNPGKRAQGEKSAISVKVQGTAGVLAKIAAVQIYRKHNLVPVALEHDALVYEVRDIQAERVGFAVKDEMENCVKLRVPLVAEIGIGESWAEAKAA